MTDYHSLVSYQKAKELTKLIIKLGETPIFNSNTGKIVYNQLFRATCSIAANIAEGYGRNNPKEYKQFLGISRGSSFETEYWLEIVRESFNVDTSQLISVNSEIIKILTTTIKNLNSNS